MPIIEYTPLPNMPPELSSGPSPSQGSSESPKGADITNLRDMLAAISVVTRPGLIESNNYVASTSGWQLNAETGIIYAVGAVISGAISGGTIDIGGADATSFHVDVSGNQWMGAATFAAAPFSVTSAGALLASSATVTGSLTTGVGSSIDGTYLANLSVTAGKIANATITATEIANATITGSKIASATITSSNITDATITGTDIASATITGGNIGSATITGGNIASSTVTGGNIATSTITGGNIDSLTINAGNIANLTITAAQIANLTITATEIANSTVTGGKVATNTITGGASGNLALTTITASNIVAGTITATQIAASTIVASNIATGTITANEIAASTITAAKMNVSTLSAIAADMGTITAGVINLSTSGNIHSGQTAYNTGTGWWLEYNSGTPRASFGNSTNYLLWTGTDLILNGYSVSDVVEGATADTNYGIFRGSNVDGLTATISNSTITRSLLSTSISFSTGSTGTSLISGTLGLNASGSTYNWQTDYSFFSRIKSASGRASSASLFGTSWFYGLHSVNGINIVPTYQSWERGRVLDTTHVGFIVDFANNLWATSGSGLAGLVNPYTSSQDLTDLTALGYTHTNFNSYKIITHYAAFPSITNTSATRPTAGTGGSWTNVANAYDGNTLSFANVGTTGQPLAAQLSWDGGTTWTRCHTVGTDASKTTDTIGDQYDTWGRTWTTGNFSNANFVLRLGKNDAGGGSPTDVMSDSVDFSSFGFSTGTWVEITGIQVDVLGDTSGGQYEIYDVQVTVYYTTSANTGYVKFYVNSGSGYTLVATHTASIPRNTDTPRINFTGYNGLNSSISGTVIFNNYRLQAVT